MNSKILTRLKAYTGVATGLLPPSKRFLEGGRWKSAPPLVLIVKLYYMQDEGFNNIMNSLCPLLILNDLRSLFNS